MKVTSSTGGKRIVSSGIGITYSRSSNYEIVLSKEGDRDLTVRFTFRTDDIGGAALMEKTYDETSNIITIECVNAEDFIGTGTTQPESLTGKLSINFWIRTSETGDNREIRYCIYEERENAGSENGT